MIKLTAPKGYTYMSVSGYNMMGDSIWVLDYIDATNYMLIPKIEEQINENDMTLEELKQLRRLQFADMQKDFAVLFATAREALGSDNPTITNLSNMANMERISTLQKIDNLANVEQALAFQIREEDAKPLKDALLSLIV